MESNNYTIGEIVLLEFPFTNLKGSKVRPALVISLSNGSNDLQVAYITSEVDNYALSPYAVVVEQGHLASGFIKQKSVIRCDKLITISHERIARKNVAQLNKSKTNEVLR